MTGITPNHHSNTCRLIQCLTEWLRNARNFGIPAEENACVCKAAAVEVCVCVKVGIFWMGVGVVHC